jgi:hypothetical protein
MLSHHCEPEFYPHHKGLWPKGQVGLPKSVRHVRWVWHVVWEKQVTSLTSRHGDVFDMQPADASVSSCRVGHNITPEDVADRI